jgi:2-polyprenyl-6-methoxyphenol hydroxylase-like FAD-dependent oxidoreductase
MPEYEAIICGAGVGGLAAAIALGRQRRRVLLIEKQRGDPHIHKGEFLQPRTLQILDEWGVLPILISKGAIRMEAMEACDANGELMGLLDYRLLPPPFNYGMAHYYHAIKESLLQVAHNLVEIRYGTRVLDLIHGTDGQVIGLRVASGAQEYDLRCTLVVGADGRLSAVRGRLGITVDMQEYPHQLMALDLAGVSHLRPRIRAFTSQEGIRSLYPMPNHQARLYVQIPYGGLRQVRQMDVRQWRQSLLASTPGLRVIADHLPADISTAQVLGAWRFSAPHWVAPGVALIGDAAHNVHPNAGQGMNAAIADVWVLAQMTQEASAGQPLMQTTVNRALVRYDSARRPQFDNIALLSHNMSTLFAITSPFQQWVARRSMRRNRDNRRLQYKVIYNMSGFGFERFTWLDRLHQLGILPDPRARRIRRNAEV